VIVRSFKTVWRSLQKMAAWLAESGVTDAAMELDRASHVRASGPAMRGEPVSGAGLSATADGSLLQDLRRSLPGLCRRLRRRGDKPVPGLALESGSCRLIWGNGARILRVASAFPQNWAFSSSILPMCSRSWV
jgi:hypothetical protein